MKNKKNQPEVENIVVEVYWGIDEDTEEKIYDIESMREEFEQKLIELTGEQYF